MVVQLSVSREERMNEIFRNYLIEEFKEDYTEGHLTRRQALKLIAGVTGSLLLANSILAACAAPPQETAAVPTTGAPTAGAPAAATTAAPGSPTPAAEAAATATAPATLDAGQPTASVEIPASPPPPAGP
jgi:carboxymethylenebutenolidase